MREEVHINTGAVQERQPFITATLPRLSDVTSISVEVWVLCICRIMKYQCRIMKYHLPSYISICTPLVALSNFLHGAVGSLTPFSSLTVPSS